MEWNPSNKLNKYLNEYELVFYSNLKLHFFTFFRFQSEFFWFTSRWFTSWIVNIFYYKSFPIMGSLDEWHYIGISIQGKDLVLVRFGVKYTVNLIVTFENCP